ncbi:conjugative relaxase domain protein [Delftia sp. Cs1-4]|uniref:MobF family relaxase n=1 Tax=Delftia sp. (strain Cs1-4) TaxID=742013 RepID=UPI00020E84DC|nr:MobF family relaxase [Delftia sp. Cs1-4]AEF89859.1 conjugative relaxase domain protein [Delftia sp. Cs1-4]
MLRIKQSKNSSYYTNEYGEKENYYDKESKGFWLGSAKEFLGLKDELTIDEYNKLFKGQSPDGKNLTYQTGKHRTYDLTLSCNKDLSILKAAYPQLAETIDKITLNAVKETLQEAQKFIAVRETKNGVTTKNFETNSVFGTFHHSTSRELDPQEHYHNLLMPVSFNSKGKAYANDVSKLFKNQKYLGNIFQKSIARELEKQLGLKTVFNEKGLSRIIGINKEERDYFSKRKEQIEKLAGDNASYRDKDLASLASRQTKKDYDLSKLQQNWNKELQEKFGFNEERLNSMRNASIETKIADKSFNKSATLNNRTTRQISIFKNIAKLSKVKPRGISSKSVASFSGSTREQLHNSCVQLQASLGSLQAQLSSMKQDDPNRLQVFSQFLSLGFQLQELQQQLAELQRKELEKTIEKNKESEKTKGRERTRFDRSSKDH